MRDIVDDRTKDRWQSLAEVVHFRDPGKAADMPKLDDRWNLGLWPGKEPGVRRAQCGDFSRSSQVSIHLEAPRETTLGQEDVGLK